MSGMLEGKTVIVSGVGPGLGREIALVCAREGANVVMGARRQENLESVAKEIENSGGAAAYSQTDITDKEQVQKLIDTAVERFGSVDSVINCAALDSIFGGVETTDESDWRATIETNVFGTMNVLRTALPHLKAAKGSVVFVGSQTNFFPPAQAQQVAYASSKGALIGAARHITREFGAHGIRVNTVAPGWMWGPPVESFVQMSAKARGVPEADVLAELSSTMPLGRLASDGDVAEVIAFFASDRAAGVTGQSILVNAGEFMQ